MLRLVLVEEPNAEPVDLATAKKHLRIEHNDEDDIIQLYLDAAIKHLDGYSGILGRCLINQKWRLDLDRWPCGRALRLPFPNVSSITEIKYLDSAGTLQTLAAGNYDTPLGDEHGSYIPFKTTAVFPALAVADNAVRVTFVAGYGPAEDDVPATIRSAILLLVAHWYKNREAVGDPDQVDLPFGVKALLAPHYA